MRKGLSEESLKATFKEFDLQKGKRSFIYVDNPENRRKGRVGQSYKPYSGDIKSVHIGSVTKEYGGGHAIYATMKGGEKHAMRLSSAEMAATQGGASHHVDIPQKMSMHELAEKKIKEGYKKVELIKPKKSESVESKKSGKHKKLADNIVDRAMHNDYAAARDLLKKNNLTLADLKGVMTDSNHRMVSNRIED